MGVKSYFQREPMDDWPRWIVYLAAGIIVGTVTAVKFKSPWWLLGGIAAGLVAVLIDYGIAPNE